MEPSLSLSHAKGRFPLHFSADLKALADKGSQQLRSQCSPSSTSLAIGMAKSLRGGMRSLTVKLKQNQQKALFCQKQEIPVLEARSIEEIYDSLAERLLPTLTSLKDSKDTTSKYIIGLAGPPGAGKTTVASEVVCRLNKLWSQKTSTQSGDVAVVLPMDGFHLYRSQLDAMENPEEAHARRGAPWTFNPKLLLRCLHSIRNQGSVYAPSFDHGVGDPVENDVFVSLKHRVVIVEGNYLFLEDGVWKEVCSEFDEKWFIEIDIDTAMERVRKRHIATGKEPDVAKWRIEYNDRPNAELIMKSKNNADLVIRSFALTSSEWIPSAVELELKRFGIKFAKEAASEGFLDVTYKNGTLEIPPLRVYDYSSSLFRNLVVYEQWLPDVGKYITNYATLMECIIAAAEGARLLGSKEILLNRLGTDAAVVGLFNWHGNHLHYASNGSYLADVFTEVRKYHESKWYNRTGDVQG